MSQTTLSLSILSAAAAAISVTFALPSQAVTGFAYSTDTTNGPTFNRPQTAGFEGGTNPPTALSTNGTSVPYYSKSFTVDTTGLYNIIGSQNFAAVQYLYQTSFDPSNPLTNVINGNDPFPDEGTSSFIHVPLTANQPYFLVTTGFDNTSVGTFTNDLTAVPNPAAVPEPTALGGIVLAGLGYSLLKRKKK